MSDQERITKIQAIASKHLWTFMGHQEQNFMISFCKGHARINVWYTRMTVATCINHPTKGRTQLFRQGVGYELLEKIFSNPRIHTARGYYTKG